MKSVMSDFEVPNTGLLPEAPVEERAEAGRRVNPRDEIMARIAARVEAAREAELGNPSEDQSLEDLLAANEATRPRSAALGEVEEDRTPRREAEPVVEAAPEPTQQPSKALLAPTSPQLFAVDVDGNTLHVTQEQMAALARQGIIANQVLHQYQTQQRYQAPAQQQPVRQQEAPPPRDRERIRQTVKAMQYGDEDSASTALENLIEYVEARNPRVDVAALNSSMAQTAREEAFRYQMAAKLAADTQVIKQEYADVMNDRYLAQMAGARVAEIRQENASLGRVQSDLDVYREAGDFVLDKFGKPRPGQRVDESTAPQAPNLVVRRSAADIEGRKRAAPRAVSQVIDRRSAAPQAPRAPTTSEVIDLMRQKRGQTSMR